MKNLPKEYAVKCVTKEQAEKVWEELTNIGNNIDFTHETMYIQKVIGINVSVAYITPEKVKGDIIDFDIWHFLYFGRPEPKFKVGDKVRVVKNTSCGNRKGYVGIIGEGEYWEDGEYVYELGDYSHSEYDLELIEDEDTHTITTDQIIKLAESNPEIKDMFPGWFMEKDEYFEFGETHEINRETQAPFFILDGLAKTQNDELKALLIGHNYELEVIPNYYNEQTALKFKLKK